MTTRIHELDSCFFGTPVIRDGRPTRAFDGWRHGTSRPFKLNKTVYDVILPAGSTPTERGLAHDMTIRQYRALRIALIKEQIKPSMVYQCCQLDDNLEPANTGRADVEVLTCRICKRRHFYATPEPMHLGLKSEPKKAWYSRLIKWIGF